LQCLQRPYIQQGNSTSHENSTVHEHYKTWQKTENTEENTENAEENKMNILPGKESKPSNL
jgi:hypothetical protein